VKAFGVVVVIDFRLCEKFRYVGVQTSASRPLPGLDASAEASAVEREPPSAAVVASASTPASLPDPDPLEPLPELEPPPESAPLLDAAPLLPPLLPELEPPSLDAFTMGPAVFLLPAQAAIVPVASANATQVLMVGSLTSVCRACASPVFPRLSTLSRRLAPVDSEVTQNTSTECPVPAMRPGCYFPIPSEAAA
jgi:hypothetical protein